MVLRKMRHNRSVKFIAIGLAWAVFITSASQGISYADLGLYKSGDTLAPNAELHGATDEDVASRYIISVIESRREAAAQAINSGHKTALDVDREIETALKAWLQQPGNEQVREIIDDIRLEIQDGRRTFRVVLAEDKDIIHSIPPNRKPPVFPSSDYAKKHNYVGVGVGPAPLDASGDAELIFRSESFGVYNFSRIFIEGIECLIVGMGEAVCVKSDRFDAIITEGFWTCHGFMARGKAKRNTRRYKKGDDIIIFWHAPDNRAFATMEGKFLKWAGERIEDPLIFIDIAAVDAAADPQHETPALRQLLDNLRKLINATPKAWNGYLIGRMDSETGDIRFALRKKVASGLGGQNDRYLSADSDGVLSAPDWTEERFYISFDEMVALLDNPRSPGVVTVKASQLTEGKGLLACLRPGITPVIAEGQERLERSFAIAENNRILTEEEGYDRYVQDVAQDAQVAAVRHISIDRLEKRQDDVLRAIEEIAGRVGHISPELRDQILALRTRRNDEFDRTFLNFMEGVKGFNSHPGRTGVHVDAQLLNADYEALRSGLEHEILGFFLAQKHGYIEQVQARLSEWEDEDYSDGAAVLAALREDFNEDRIKPLDERADGDDRDWAMADGGKPGEWAGFEEDDIGFLQQAAELAGDFIQAKGHQPSISDMVPLLLKVLPEFTAAENKGAALAVKFKNCAKKKVERAGGDLKAKEERVEAEYDALLAKLRVSKGPGGPGTVKAEERLERMRVKSDELADELEVRRPTIAETARALKKDGTDFARSSNPAQAAYRWLKAYAEREGVDYDELIDDYLDLARGPVSEDQPPAGSFYSVFKALLDSAEPLTLAQITERVNAAAVEGARQVGEDTVRRDLGTLGQGGYFSIVDSRGEGDARIFFPTEEARLSGTPILDNILRPLRASRLPVDLRVAQRSIERTLRRAREVTPAWDITAQLRTEMTSLRPGDRVVVSGAEVVVRGIDDGSVTFIPVANWDSSDDRDYPDRISTDEFASGLKSGDVTVYRLDAADEIVASGARAIADGFGTGHTNDLFSFMREEAGDAAIILGAIMDGDGRVMAIGTDINYESNRLSGYVREQLERGELYQITLAVTGEHRGRTGRPYCRVHDVQNAPGQKAPSLAVQRAVEAAEAVNREYRDRRLEDSELMPDDTRLLAAVLTTLHDDSPAAGERVFEILSNRQQEQEINSDMAAECLELIEELQAVMTLPEARAMQELPACRFFRALYRLAMLVESRQGLAASQRDILLDRYFRGGTAASASLTSTDSARLALTKLAAPELPPPGTDGNVPSGMAAWFQRRNWIRRANKGNTGALSSLVGHIEVDYVGRPEERSQAVDEVANALNTPYREKFLVRVDPQIMNVTAEIARDSRNLKPGDRIVTPDGAERIITYAGSGNLRYISTAQGAHGQRVSSYSRCDDKLEDGGTRVYRFEVIDEGIQHNVKALPKAEAIQAAWALHGIDMPSWSTVESDEGGHVVARCAMDTDGFILPLDERIEAHDERVVNGEVFLIDVDYKKFPTGEMREPHYRLNAVEHFHGRIPSGEAIQRAFYSLQVAGRWSQAESRRKAELCNIERCLIVASVLEMRGRHAEAIEALEGYMSGRYPALSNIMAKEFRDGLANYQEAGRGVDAVTLENDPLHLAIEALKRGIIRDSGDPQKAAIYTLFFEIPTSAFATLVLGRSPEEPEIDDVPERIACALDKETAKLPPAGTDGNVISGGLEWFQRKRLISRNVKQANAGNEAALNWLTAYIAEDFVTRPDDRPQEIARIGRRLNSPHREKFLAQANPRSVDVTSAINSCADLLPGDRVITTEDIEMVVLQVEERYIHHIRDSVANNTRSILSRIIVDRLIKEGMVTVYRFEGDDEIVQHSAGLLPQGLNNREELIQRNVEPQEAHLAELEEALPPGYSLIQCVMDRDGMILPLDSGISPFDERIQNGELYHVALQYKAAQTGNAYEPHYRICYIHRASSERPPSMALQRLYRAVRIADEGSRLAARDRASFSSNEMRMAVAILLAAQNRPDDAMDVLRNVDETPEMDPYMAMDCRAVLRRWRRLLAASENAVSEGARATIESDPMYVAVQGLRDRIETEGDRRLQIRYLAVRDGYVRGETGEEGSPFDALIDEADRVELVLDKEIYAGVPAGFRGGAFEGANRGEREALNDLVVASSTITSKLRPECIRDISAALSPPHREKFLAGINPRCEEVTELLRTQPMRLRPCDRIITRGGGEWIVRRIAKEHVHFIDVIGGAASQSVLPILDFMREVQRCRRAYRFREDDEIIAHNNEMLPKGRRLQGSLASATSTRFYGMYGDETPEGYAALDCAMDRDGYFLKVSTHSRDYEEEAARGEVFYPVFHAREKYSGSIHHPHYRFRHIVCPGENDAPGIAVQRMLHSFMRANTESIRTAREEAELSPNENRMAVALAMTMRGRFVEAVDVLHDTETDPVLDAGMAGELRDAIREYIDMPDATEETRLDRAIHALDIEMRRGPDMLYLLHFDSTSIATSATLASPEDRERIELALDKKIRAGGARQGGVANVEDVDRHIDLANNEDTPGVALDWLVSHVGLIRDTFTSPERTQDEIRSISERLRPGLRERFLALAYEWEDWIVDGPSDNALADLVRVSLGAIDDAVQDSMAPLVEVLTMADAGISGDFWGYPRTCRIGAQLAALYILNGFHEEVVAGRIHIQHARGRIFARTHGETGLENGMEHDWLIVYIDGEPYYFSFTDGQFGWMSDDERSRAYAEAAGTDTMEEFEEQFLEEYRRQGFDRPIMRPWREVEHYYRIEEEWDWTAGRDLTASVSRAADILGWAGDDLMEAVLRGLMSLGNDSDGNSYFNRAVSSIFLEPRDRIEDIGIGATLAGHIRAAYGAGRLREACPLLRRLTAYWADGEGARVSDCVMEIEKLADAGPKSGAVSDDKGEPELPKGSYWAIFDLLWREGPLTRSEIAYRLGISRSTVDKDLAILGPGRAGNNFRLVTHEENPDTGVNECRLTDECLAMADLMDGSLRILGPSRNADDLNEARDTVNYLRNVFREATININEQLDSFELRAQAMMETPEDQIDQSDEVAVGAREWLSEHGIGWLRQRMEEIAATGVAPVRAFIRALQESQGATPEEWSQEQRAIIEAAQQQCPDLNFNPEEIVFCTNEMPRFFWAQGAQIPGITVRITDGTNIAYPTDLHARLEEMPHESAAARDIHILIHERLHRRNHAGRRRIRQDEPRLASMYNALEEGMNEIRAARETVAICQQPAIETYLGEEGTPSEEELLMASGYIGEVSLTSGVLNACGPAAESAVETFLSDGDHEPLRGLLGERTFEALAHMLSRQTPATRLAETYDRMRMQLVVQLIGLPLEEREENVDTAMALLRAMGDVFRSQGLERREDDVITALRLIGYIPIEFELSLFYELIEGDAVPNRRQLGVLCRQAFLQVAEDLNRQMEAMEAAEAHGEAIPPGPGDLPSIDEIPEAEDMDPDAGLLALGRGLREDGTSEGNGTTAATIGALIEQANQPGEAADEALDSLAAYIEKDVPNERRDEEIGSISSRLIRKDEFIARTFTIGSLAGGMVWPVREDGQFGSYYVIADELFPVDANLMVGLAVADPGYNNGHSSYEQEMEYSFNSLEDMEAGGVPGAGVMRQIIERGNTVLLSASQMAAPAGVSGDPDSMFWNITPEEEAMSIMWHENLHRAFATLAYEEQGTIKSAVANSWIDEVYAAKNVIQHHRGLIIGTWKNADEALALLFSQLRDESKVLDIISRLLGSDPELAAKVERLWRVARPGEEAVRRVMVQARKAVVCASRVSHTAEAPRLVRATAEDVASVETDIGEASDYIWNECIDDEIFKHANRLEAKTVIPIILDLDYLPPGMQRSVLEGTGEERIATLSLIRRNLERRLGKNIECRILPTSGQTKDALLEYANETYKNLEQEQKGKVVQKPLVITTDTKVAAMTEEEVRRNNIADITAVTPRPFMTVDGEMQEPFIHTQALVSYAVIKSRLTNVDFRLGKQSATLQRLSRLHQILTGETLNISSLPPAMIDDPTASALEFLIGLPPATRVFDSDQMRDLMRAEEARLRSA